MLGRFTHNSHPTLRQIGPNNYHAACLKCEECGVTFGGDQPGPFMVAGRMLCKPDATKAKKVEKRTSLAPVLQLEC